MILLTFAIIFIAGFVDFLIKEKLIIANVGAGKRWLAWEDVPRFWKDYVPDRSIYAPRYAYVVNGLFAALCELSYYLLYGDTGYGGPAYIVLLWTNWEHIAYQWWAGLFMKNRRLFDLPNLPLWLEGLPWNKQLARYHGEPIVTSEEILTIALFGIGAMHLFDYAYSYLKGLL